MFTQNHPDLWLSYVPRRIPDSNKYDFGHALIFGAEKMTGATRLAAESCARIGAGLTTVIAPTPAADIYRAALPPHIIVEDYSGKPSKHLEDERRNAVLIGPGAGDDYKETLKIIRAASASGRAMVLDADALNALAAHPYPDSLPQQRKNVVLTPHGGEFERLFTELKGDRQTKARKAAESTGCVIVLKGNETIIAAPGHEPVMNRNAPPGLATAGTGDVLAGMMTGLLAQGMDGFYAACAAVWIHGESATRFGPGLVASDLLNQIAAILNILDKDKRVQ